MLFIPPAAPRSRPRPPLGGDWIHEIKFDGYRIQLHKQGRDVTLLSKNGHEFTSRFPTITYVAQSLPASLSSLMRNLLLATQWGCRISTSCWRRAAIRWQALDDP